MTQARKQSFPILRRLRYGLENRIRSSAIHIAQEGCSDHLSRIRTEKVVRPSQSTAELQTRVPQNSLAGRQCPKLAAQVPCSFSPYIHYMLHIYMCVCVCVCMYECMYICIYTYINYISRNDSGGLLPLTSNRSIYRCAEQLCHASNQCTGAWRQCKLSQGGVGFQVVGQLALSNLPGKMDQAIHHYGHTRWHQVVQYLHFGVLKFDQGCNIE